MTTKVIYHADCLDGLGAAWACYQRLGENAEYIPAQYNDPPPPVTKDDLVLIVDFSYKRNVLKALADRADFVQIIDHHRTARDELAGLDTLDSNIGVTFDMEQSGAVLAWKHFFPDDDVPPGLLLIQDRDLWKWRFSTTKAFTAALYGLYRENWKEWLLHGSDWCNCVYDDGKVLVQHQKKIVGDSVKRFVGATARIGGYTVPCINLTGLVSETLNEVLKSDSTIPFAACYFDIVAENKRVFSLRSADDRVDVSEIAKKYGGGGHHNAAGFTTAMPLVII